MPCTHTYSPNKPTTNKSIGQSTSTNENKTNVRKVNECVRNISNYEINAFISIARLNNLMGIANSKQQQQPDWYWIAMHRIRPSAISHLYTFNHSKQSLILLYFINKYDGKWTNGHWTKCAVCSIGHFLGENLNIHYQWHAAAAAIADDAWFVVICARVCICMSVCVYVNTLSWDKCERYRM